MGAVDQIDLKGVIGPRLIPYHRSQRWKKTDLLQLSKFLLVESHSRHQEILTNPNHSTHLLEMMATNIIVKFAENLATWYAAMAAHEFIIKSVYHLRIRRGSRWRTTTTRGFVQNALRRAIVNAPVKTQIRLIESQVGIDV
jgi:hypothetical protein